MNATRHLIVLPLVLLLFLSDSLLAQWVKRDFPTTDRLYEITFGTPSVGWVASTVYPSPYTSNIYKTTDGGTKWRAVNAGLASGLASPRQGKRRCSRRMKIVHPRRSQRGLD